MIKELQIELTNACNASCTMCAHRYMKRPIKHMDLGLLSKIVDEAKGLLHEPYVLGICGIGEPILHPQLKEALKIVSQLPFALGTNCQALDREKQLLIINSKFTDITLSIDSVSREVHDKMRPRLDFDTVLFNALSFLAELRMGKRFWRTIYIQLIATDENKHEVDSFVDFWKKETEGMEGVIIFIKPMYQWPGLDNPFFPGPNFSESKNENVVFGHFQDRTFRSRCQLFDNWALIQSDGAYQPCCMPVEDEYKIGNVKDNTIVELYNSPRMEKLRELFKNKRYDEIPFCSKCI